MSFRVGHKLWSRHCGGHFRRFAFAGTAVLLGYGTSTESRRAYAETKFNPAKSRVYSCGSSQYYQTGLGHAQSIAVPAEVAQLRSKNIVQLSCGGQQSMALTDSGEVYTFGRGENYRLGHGTNTNESYSRVVDALKGENVVTISAGERHMAAVTDKGELWTWGKGASLQLGHKPSNVPEKVVSLSDEKIVEVSCGTGHTLARTEDGRVFAVGTGKSGALGMGTRDNQKEFKLIEHLKDENISQIAAGEDFSLFLTKSGDVYSSGASDFGQSGLGQAERYFRTPTKLNVLADHKVVWISAGTLHACAITSDGKLFTWGENKRGQLGHGDNYHKWTPHQVQALESVHITSSSCGAHHTAVISDSHEVYVFGDGRSGQLARGDHVEGKASFRLLPIEVTCFKTLKCNVWQLALGSDHTVALCTEN